MAAKGLDVNTRSKQSDSTEFIDIICKDGEAVRIEAELFKRSEILDNLKRQGGNSINVEFHSDIVNNMLEYLRQGNVNLQNFEEKKSLYSLSYQFGIKDLQDLCREDLNNSANEDNICTLHDLACAQNDRHLQYYCWKKFDTYSDTLFLKEDFLNCTKDTILRFVSRPISTASSEFNLFFAVCRWADHRKQRASDSTDDLRPYLGEIIRHIRFLSMSRIELEIALTQNIFNEQEKQKIMDYKDGNSVILPRHINKTTDGRTAEKYPSLFDYINKHGQSKRNKKIATRWHFIGEFQTDYDCFLIGLLLPITEICSQHGITVNILITLDNSNLSQTAECMQSGKVILKPPVFISETIQSVKVKVKVSEEEILANPNMIIPSGTPYYMTQEEIRIRKAKKRKQQIDHIYADVILWF